MQSEFHSQLSLHAVLANGRFEDLLDGAEEASRSVDAQVDIPKFARADASSELEISYLDAGGGRLR